MTNAVSQLTILYAQSLSKFEGLVACKCFYCYARRLRTNKNAPNSDDPDRNNISVVGSGTAPLAAENENTESADGFCVVRLNVPGVGPKPFPEIVPTP